MPSRPRPAFPSRSARGIRAATAGLLVLAAAALSAPPALAGIPVGPQLSIRGSARVQGLPAGWRLNLSVFHHGSSSVISLETATRNEARTATAEQTWSVSTAKVSCTASLSTCSVNDQGAFGRYGRVKLTFEPRGPKVTRSLRCPSNDALIGTEVRRIGVLAGTLRLDTKSKTAGVIRNGKGAHRVPLKLPVTVLRETFNGTPCPTDLTSCGSVGHLHSSDLHLQIDRPLPTGKGTIFYARTVASAEPTVTRDQRVSGTLPGATLLELQTADTLAAASGQLDAAPFLTGTVTFTATTPKVDDQWYGCPDIERNGQISMDLTLRMPGRKKVVISNERTGTLAVETAP